MQVVAYAVEADVMVQLGLSDVTQRACGHALDLIRVCRPSMGAGLQSVVDDVALPSVIKCD